MPHSISTLLTRNLQEVFGEGDPARRRAAIDDIYTDDCVFLTLGRAFTRAGRGLVESPGAIRADRPSAPVHATTAEPEELPAP